MKLTDQHKQDMIFNSKIHLENASQDPYIKENILIMGYNENRMNEGLALQQKAWQSREKQISSWHNARGLNARLKDILKQKRKTLVDDVRLLKSIFKRNLDTQKRLGLTGRRRRNPAGFTEESRALYGIILGAPDILQDIAKFNLTAEVIENRLKSVAELEEAYRLYKEADKTTLDASDVSKKDFKQLMDWMREFRDACRIVLIERQQLLEKVGLMVRSAKLSRKKNNGSSPSTNDTQGNTPGNNNGSGDGDGDGSSGGSSGNSSS